MEQGPSENPCGISEHHGDPSEHHDHEDRFLAIQYVNEEFGERISLMSGLVLALTLRKASLSNLYRIPLAYVCEEITDLVYGLIWRNHGIYLTHIKLRLTWTGIGMLVGTAFMVACGIMAAEGTVLFVSGI